MKKRFLAFDIGSENGRATVGTLKDGILTTDELLSFKNKPVRIGGQDRWNVYQYFDYIVEALKAYSRKYGPSLDAIGVDSWGFDFGMTDDRGQLISLPVCPVDSDFSDARRELDSELGNRRHYELTGIPNMPMGTAAQLIAMTDEHDLSVVCGRRLLFISDIINYFLTDSGACEKTMAHSSGLIDIETGKWSGEIFDLFGIPDALMSDIIEPGAKVGTLTPHLTTATGLDAGTPVYAPASLSAVSASIAIPRVSGTVAFINSGARAVCAIETERPLLTDISYNYSLANMPSVYGRNLLLSLSNGLALIGRCRSCWRKHDPKLNYAQIAEYAKKAPAFAGMIDIDDPLFRGPYSMPEMIAQFVERSGQQSVDAGDIGVISRIIYESLALKYRYAFDKLRRATLKSFDTLHIVGGGANSELLNQFCANAMNVTVISGPPQATAIGNILVQAGADGEFSSIDDMRDCVGASFPHKTYSPEDTQLWDDGYKRFLSLMGLN